MSKTTNEPRLPKKKGGQLAPTALSERIVEGLLASIRVLDAITLVLESRVVRADKRHPTIILALILVRNDVATDASAVEISGDQPGCENDSGANLIA
jgi:hypothetical protein